MLVVPGPAAVAEALSRGWQAPCLLRGSVDLAPFCGVLSHPRSFCPNKAQEKLNRRGGLDSPQEMLWETFAFRYPVAIPDGSALESALWMNLPLCSHFTCPHLGP
jgi:hypothetical protein